MKRSLSLSKYAFGLSVITMITLYPFTVYAIDFVTSKEFKKSKIDYRYLPIDKLFERLKISSSRSERRQILNLIIMKQVFEDDILKNQAGGMAGYADSYGIIKKIFKDRLEFRDEQKKTKIFILDYDKVPIEKKGFEINESNVHEYTVKLFAMHDRVYKVEVLEYVGPPRPPGYDELIEIGFRHIEKKEYRAAYIRFKRAAGLGGISKNQEYEASRLAKVFKGIQKADMLIARSPRAFKSLEDAEASYRGAKREARHLSGRIKVKVLPIVEGRIKQNRISLSVLANDIYNRIIKRLKPESGKWAEAKVDLSQSHNTIKKYLNPERKENVEGLIGFFRLIDRADVLCKGKPEDIKCLEKAIHYFNKAEKLARSLPLDIKLAHIVEGKLRENRKRLASLRKDIQPTTTFDSLMKAAKQQFDLGHYPKAYSNFKKASLSEDISPEEKNTAKFFMHLTEFHKGKPFDSLASAKAIWKAGNVRIEKKYIRRLANQYFNKIKGLLPTTDWHEAKKHLRELDPDLKGYLDLKKKSVVISLNSFFDEIDKGDNLCQEEPENIKCLEKALSNYKEAGQSGESLPKDIKIKIKHIAKKKLIENWRRRVNLAHEDFKKIKNAIKASKWAEAEKLLKDIDYNYEKYLDKDERRQVADLKNVFDYIDKGDKEAALKLAKTLPPPDLRIVTKYVEEKIGGPIPFDQIFRAGIESFDNDNYADAYSNFKKASLSEDISPGLKNTAKFFMHLTQSFKDKDEFSDSVANAKAILKAGNIRRDLIGKKYIGHLADQYFVKVKGLLPTTDWHEAEKYLKELDPDLKGYLDTKKKGIVRKLINSFEFIDKGDNETKLEAAIHYYDCALGTAERLPPDLAKHVEGKIRVAQNSRSSRPQKTFFDKLWEKIRVAPISKSSRPLGIYFEDFGTYDVKGSISKDRWFWSDGKKCWVGGQLGTFEVTRADGTGVESKHDVYQVSDYSSKPGTLMYVRVHGFDRSQKPGDLVFQKRVNVPRGSEQFNELEANDFTIMSRHPKGITFEWKEMVAVLHLFFDKDGTGSKIGISFDHKGTYDVKGSISKDKWVWSDEEKYWGGGQLITFEVTTPDGTGRDKEWQFFERLYDRYQVSKYSYWSKIPLRVKVYGFDRSQNPGRLVFQKQVNVPRDGEQFYSFEANDFTIVSRSPKEITFLWYKKESIAVVHLYFRR